MSDGDVVVAMDAGGLTFIKIGPRASTSHDAITAAITRTYNTGYMVFDIRGAWLANSKTVDRSYKANTLTENGTVTEAAVASGAELKGYTGWSASNYFSRANDSDFDTMGSIVFWIKAPTNITGGSNYILAKRNNGGGAR